MYYLDNIKKAWVHCGNAVAASPMSLFQISHRQIWQVRIGLTAACLVSPVALHAQASQQGNFEEVALKFDLRHHGNVARSNAVAAAARGLTISDEQLTVGVEVTCPSSEHSAQLAA